MQVLAEQELKLVRSYSCCDVSLPFCVSLSQSQVSTAAQKASFSSGSDSATLLPER